MYGLLATETYSIFALFPHLIKANHNRENVKANEGPLTQRTNGIKPQPSLSELSDDSVGFDMTRGELILFENEPIFLGAVFKLGVQFYLLQGMKASSIQFF